MTSCQISPTHCICFCMFIFCIHFGFILGDCNVENDLFVIRSSVSGVVVSASQHPTITIQQYTGAGDQLWKFERGTKPNSYYILNNETEIALSIINCTSFGSSSTTCEVIGSEKSDSLEQQWIITSKNKLINANISVALDIENADYTPGNYLGAYTNREVYGNQLFILQGKTYFENTLIGE